MENINKYTIEVDNLLALSYILDEYNDFIPKLNNIVKTKEITELIVYLKRLENDNKKPFYFGKINKFYKENKDIIQTINKYGSIGKFISFNYNRNGELEEKEGLNYFYNYMINNIEDIERIREVLRKLKELNFTVIKFDPNQDFTKETYSLYRNFSANTRIEFLDNIEVIPNYEYDQVKYKTDDSSFKINVGVSHLSGEIEKYDINIIVKDLLFNPEHLPEQITKATIFNSITDVKEQQLDSCVQIRNSVDLSIGIDDLKDQFEKTKLILNSLTSIKEKERMNKILGEILNQINELQGFSQDFDESLSKNNKNITSELLDEEKKLYIKRREFSKIDLD